MTGEDYRQSSNAQGRRRDNRVIVRYMGMNHIEASVFQSGAQAQSAHRNVGIERAIAPSGENHAMTMPAQCRGEFQDVSFTAAEGFCRVNLQNAHCGLRNRRPVRGG